mmetsp:Transcript_9385/g.18311  ORF Transcript_9385/g.18311 Transcript_9385/m.18311 type:complete len:150 (-) Transcript_9385:2998-3447(-)
MYAADAAADFTWAETIFEMHSSSTSAFHKSTHSKSLTRVIAALIGTPKTTPVSASSHCPRLISSCALEICDSMISSLTAMFSFNSAHHTSFSASNHKYLCVHACGDTIALLPVEDNLGNDFLYAQQRGACVLHALSRLEDAGTDGFVQS